MSLSEFGLRLTTVRALRGATLVGDAVFDEPVEPISNVLDGEGDAATARPVIAVYTNLSVAKVKDNDLLCNDKNIDLTVQIYLPYVTGIGGNETAGAIKGREAGGKLLTDLVSRQILRVFLHDVTPWAKLRRKFHFRTEEVRSQSFIMATNTKFEIAAREVVFKCETIAEPNFGKNPTGAYQELIALITATADLQPLAAMIEAEIKNPVVTPEWRALMAELGVTDAGANAIGMTLGLMPAAEDAPVTAQVTVVNEDGGGVVVDDGSHVTE